MLSVIKKFAVEEDGISSVEYAILLAFIAAALVTAVTVLRDQVINAFNGACQELKGSAC
jgi:Flp pilus assembly pilin Flp